MGKKWFGKKKATKTLVYNGITNFAALHSIPPLSVLYRASSMQAVPRKLSTLDLSLGCSGDLRGSDRHATDINSQYIIGWFSNQVGCQRVPKMIDLTISRSTRDTSHEQGKSQPESVNTKSRSHWVQGIGCVQPNVAFTLQLFWPLTGGQKSLSVVINLTCRLGICVAIKSSTGSEWQWVSTVWAPLEFSKNKAKTIPVKWDIPWEMYAL